MQVHEGRWTTGAGDRAVAFLIGFRINRWRAVRYWMPVLLAMPGMIRELTADPDSGFLGARNHVGPRGATMIQYWRSVEDLHRFANDPDRSHRKAWLEFYGRAAASRGAVGVWHETFDAVNGGVETIYSDMPRTGFATARGITHERVADRSATARERLHRA